MPCEKLLRREVRLLRIVGLHSISSIFTGRITKSTVWETVSFAVGLINLLLILWFKSLKIIEVWSTDPDEVISVTSTALSITLCCIKGSRIWSSREELYQLLRRLVIMWTESHDRGWIGKESTKLASQTCSVGRSYIIVVTLACITYGIRPYTFLLRYHWYDKFQNTSYDYTVTVFAAKYPWSTETPIKYIICLFWEQFGMLSIGLYTLSADIIYTQLATHAAIQFQILQDNFKCIASQLNHGNRDHERILIHRLSTLVERHCDLYRYSERIKQTFEPIIFMTLVVTAANVCLCTFQLEKELSKGNWYEVGKYIFHAAVLAAHTSMYCSYAESLSQQSSLIAQAAYECDWIQHSKEFIAMLYIVIIRALKPPNSSVYGLLTPNMREVAKIFRAAASYFTLLKALT